MAAWQSRLVREKRRFFDFNWLPWQRPLKNQKKNGVIKPFHLSTIPEILVKIGPLASEPAGLRGRPLKKNKEKNIGKIYSPSGNFAERAKQNWLNVLLKYHIFTFLPCNAMLARYMP